MKGKMLTIALVLLGTSMLFGQGGYKGSVQVEVLTEDGTPLPGAVAMLTADTFSRSFVSDAKGNIRFVGLVPGSYELKITFAGFNTYLRPNINVDTGQNIRLDAVMVPSAQVEEMVVTAETPLIDTTKMGTSTVLTEEELNAVPQSRDPWSVLSTIPGVQTDRVNVGGSEAGQQSRFASKGDSGFNTSWVMDGIEFVDPAARGGSQSYLDFSSFAQMGVTTGGADVSQRSGGAALNFVTKQGSNNHQGSVRLLYSDQDFQGSTGITNDITGQEVRRNAIGETFEKTFEIGGPVIKDRLWYWGSFSQNSVTNLVPTSGGDFQEDRTELRNISLKFHGDITATTRFNAFYTEGDKVKNGRDASVARPRNTTWNQSGPTPIYKFELSQLIGQHTELSFLAARVDGGFALEPVGPSNAQIGRDWSTGIWEDTTFFNYKTTRPVRQYEVKGNTFLAGSALDHELQYGFQYKQASVASASTYGDDSLVRRLNPPWLPTGTQSVLLYREGNKQSELEYTSASLQDTMTYGNWTFKAGLRYDSQEGNNIASTVRANPLRPDLLPGTTVSPQEVPVSWDTLAPRLGATYTWGEDNQYLVRGSISTFYDTLGSGSITPTLASVAKYSYHYWYDDGDNVVQVGELTDQLSGNINNINDEIDPDLKPPKVDEILIGFEWAVTPEFTVGINSTMRERSDTLWTTLNGDFGPEHFDRIDAVLVAENNRLTGEEVTVSHYVLNDAGEAIIPDRNGDGVVDSRDLNNILTNRPDYTEDYFDIELTATKRLSNRWMMRANITFIDWTRNVGENSIVDPTNFQTGINEDGAQRAVRSGGAKANTFYGSSTWSGNVNGLYQMPWDMAISSNITFREGYAQPFAFQTQSTDFRGTNTSMIKLDSFDTFRGDDVFTTDLKLTKTFHLSGRTKVEIAAELFNAFNEDVVLSRELQVFDQAASSSTNRTNHPTEWLSPRVGRFSATVHF